MQWYHNILNLISLQGSVTSKYASSALGIAYLGDFSNGISAGAKQAILDIVKTVFNTIALILLE